MNSLFESARWAAIGQAARILGQVVSLTVLSRLLPPSAYGVMAMAGIVTALAAMLREMGTGAAIIQRKTLTPEFTNTAFWANLALGTLLGAALALASPLIGRFFHEPQLPGVLVALALLFPLNSWTAVHQAIIERRSDFRTLAALETVNQVVGLLAAIAAALAGAGVYSFVVPTAVSAVIGSVWLLQRSGWRPQWMWRTEELKQLWQFSGTFTAFNYVNYFARNADGIIIGRLLGSVALGTYGMAYKLMLFPVQNIGWIVNRVLLPRLSALQDDPAETRRLYFKCVGAICTISAPLMITLWVAREPFVDIALGHSWSRVVPLLAWLAPVGLLQSMVSTIGTVFTSAGNTRMLLFIGIGNTLLYLVGFVAGAAHGVEGVAAGYFFANLVAATVTAWLTGRQLQARAHDLWEALRAPLLSALLAGALAQFADQLFVSLSAPASARLIGICTLSGVLYVAFITMLFNQGLQPVINLVRGRA